MWQQVSTWIHRVWAGDQNRGGGGILGVFEAMGGDEIPYEDREFIREESLSQNPEELSQLESRKSRYRTEGRRERPQKRQNNAEVLMPFLSKQTLSCNSHLRRRRPLHCQRHPRRVEQAPSSVHFHWICF